MRLRVGDTRLYFDVAGMALVPDGPTMRELPTIVCLHGGPGFDHSTLKPYLAPLADSAQLVFLDQRGQGRSDPSPRESWKLDTWIADVHAFCLALEIDAPIILGQSFGGIVALGVAIRHPELPAKLVISSSPARFREERALAMFERLGGEEARGVAERFFRSPSDESFQSFMQTCLPLYNPSPRNPDVLARVRLKPELTLHFFGGELRTFDWLGQLAHVRCPTLILAGELDPIATVADHEDLAAAIPGARLEVFENAGHGVFRDRPETALGVIRDFVLAADAPPASRRD